MANTFLQYVIRQGLREVRHYIIGMIPKKVRKNVGWILLIIGAVAILFSLTDNEEIFIITSIVGIFSIVLGLIFLTNSVSMVSGR